MCSEYNGWSNYETWNANLWINNEEGVSVEAYEQCKQAMIYCQDEALPRYQAVYRLGEVLEQFFTDVWFNEDREASPKGDAIGSYLSSINWQEIASHYYDEISEELEEEASND
jgi:hypothetical protein